MLDSATVHRIISSISAFTSTTGSDDIHDPGSSPAHCQSGTPLPPTHPSPHIPSPHHFLPGAGVHEWRRELAQRSRGAHPPQLLLQSLFSPPHRAGAQLNAYVHTLSPSASASVFLRIPSSPPPCVVLFRPRLLSPCQPSDANKRTLYRNDTSPYLKTASPPTATLLPGNVPCHRLVSLPITRFADEALPPSSSTAPFLSHRQEQLLRYSS